MGDVDGYRLSVACPNCDTLAIDHGDKFIICHSCGNMWMITGSRTLPSIEEEDEHGY